MNAEEYFEQEHPHFLKANSRHYKDFAIQFAEGYKNHCTKAENLHISDVVGQSEQLKAFLIWLEKEGYNCAFEWDDSTIEDYLKSL